MEDAMEALGSLKLIIWTNGHYFNPIMEAMLQDVGAPKKKKKKKENLTLIILVFSLC
jgi:hypothetical protein